MFIRQKKNSSGSISVQIISKPHGKYKVIKSFGSSSIPEKILSNVLKAKQEIRRLESSPSMFVLERDVLLESFLSEVGNAQIRTIGPELVFGRIFTI